MLSNLQVILFFNYLVINSVEKILIYYLAIGNIIVYCTIIILNLSNKVTNYIILRIVNSWLI